MKLVVDANRVISALLRDGETRRAFFTTKSKLFAPTFLRREVDKRRGEFVRRSGLSEADFQTLFGLLSARIGWVPDRVCEAHTAEASAALGKVDPDDVPYVACALAIGADAIWSHDKHFDEQDIVPRVAHPDVKPSRGKGRQAGGPA